MSLNWVPLLLAAVSLALLYWQGSALIGRKQHSSVFGKLTLFLAVLLTLLQILLLSGVAVYAPEFHLLMVEGAVAYVCLAALLLGLAVTASIGWYISLPSARWNWLRGLAIIGAGFAMGIWAIYHIRLLDSLNPNTPITLRVHAFELLWPGLLLWLALCLFTAVARRMAPGRGTLQAVLVLVALLATCRGVLSWTIFLDPGLASLWFVCSALLRLLLLLTVGVWLVNAVGPPGRIRRAIAFVCVLVISLAGAVAVPARSAGLYWTLGLSLLLLFSLIACRIAWSELRAFNVQKAKERWQELWDGYKPRALVIVDTRITRFQGNWKLWMVIIATFGGFLAASYMAGTDPLFRFTGLALGPGLDASVGLSATIFVWVVLIEIFGLGPLTGEVDNMEPSPARRSWLGLRAMLRSLVALTGVRNQATAAVPALAEKKAEGAPEAAPEAVHDEVAPKSEPRRPKSPVLAWAGLVAKTLVGVVILIAVSEIPNFHKTLVQPFQAKVKDVDASAGQEISDEVINGLGEISQKLRPLVWLAPPKSAGTQLTFRAVPETEVSSVAAEALGKGNSLGLPGGVSLPLNMLLLPVQAPMRYLLGVRVINGSLHKVGQGYTLLAASSDGETWSVHSDKPLEAAVPELASRMAFKIATRDRGFEALGMGSNSDAFELFQKGLDEWDQYSKNQDLTALTNSIRLFREAAREDPDFALAQYRLALALQKDGNPSGAVEALRASISADPKFVPGYVALASTLQNFDSYYLASAAILQDRASSDDERKAHDAEARAVWQQVLTLHSDRVSLSDAAAAYYGLCNDELDYGKPELAYFYCKRAGQYYARLPMTLRDTYINRDSEANVLNNVGLVLYSQHQSVLETDAWLCAEDSVKIDTLDLATGIVKRKYWVGPYSRVARQYFDLAQGLQPEDGTLACNAAMAAYGLGMKEPMRSLEMRSAARLLLGDFFGRLAKEKGNSAYLLLALREYDTAINLNPDSIWALNNYAYRYWEFRLASPERMLPVWIGRNTPVDAEEFARRAGLLARERMLKQDNSSVQSTLGEVLLANGKPAEAVAAINIALQSTPKHPFFDEVHWDLSQAYLCYSVQSGNGGKADIEAEQNAAGEMDKIRQSAVAHEDPRWTEFPWILDEQVPHADCSEEKARVEADRDFQFVLEGGGPVYQSAGRCGWQGVSASAAPGLGQPLTDFRLYVWGGGVEGNVSVQYAAPSDFVFLTSQPKATRNVYFAQLWAKRVYSPDALPVNGPASRFVPVSEVVSVPTYPEGPGPVCRRNAIILSFVPATQ